MIITMITMRMMQVAVDEVVNVIAVRNRFMAASRTVNVSRIMLSAIMPRCAISRVCRAYRYLVLFHYSIVPHPVQVTIMQVIGVVFVLNTCMPTSRPMYVFVIFMRVIGHQRPPTSYRSTIC
jgi:hypothetical protein